jgi:2-dehydro-3-deoxygluconokinase
MMQGGVDLSHLQFVPYDGVGRTVRNGLNFTERGFGPRRGLGCYDRGSTAISQMRPQDVDWRALFGREGARFFHTGGIYAALSETAPLVAELAMREARAHGTRISYDLNYRESLWRAIGGRERAKAVNGSLLRSVDVLLGDVSAALGLELDGRDSNAYSMESHRKMIGAVIEKYPNLTAVATTLRTARSATVNGWGAICYYAGRFYETPPRDVEIFDRVGGGDSFASGFLYGLMSGKDPEWALKCGVAHGALAMSTPGDATMATLSEVTRAMTGAHAHMDR